MNPILRAVPCAPLEIEAQSHLWLGRPTAPAPGELPAIDRQRLAGITHAGRAEEYAAAHAWLRRVLAGYLGTPPWELQFHSGRWGKPGLVGYPLQFNLSHTRGYCALAVSDRPLGVDIERLDRDLRRAMLYCGTPAERRVIESAPTAEVVARWSVKEAYTKALGLGHARTFAAIETVPPDDPGVEPWRIRGDIRHRIVARYDLKGHVVAVAHHRRSPLTRVLRDSTV